VYVAQMGVNGGLKPPIFVGGRGEQRPNDGG
jgi:hypothetical protein